MQRGEYLTSLLRLAMLLLLMKSYRRLQTLTTIAWCLLAIGVAPCLSKETWNRSPGESNMQQKMRLLADGHSHEGSGY